MPKKCCICFVIYTRKIQRSFYVFPNFTVCSQKSSRERILIERRRNLWMQLSQRNVNTFSGTLFVCSDHFVSGKPAYLHLTEDVDWVPTLNLGYIQQDKQYLSTDSGCTTKCESSIQATAGESSATTGASKKRRNSIRETTILKPMVTIFNSDILHDNCPEKNLSASVQFALDQDITVKEEQIDVEDLFEASAQIFQEDTAYPFQSIPTAECGTQVDLDQLCCPLQLDKFTQTEMSSFPKPKRCKKRK